MGYSEKIPGMGGMGQLNQMRKAAQGMMGGGGMPAGMGDMFGGAIAPPKVIDRDKQKLRKAVKDARKKNRR